jgi:predicted transcriptional regulator
MSRVFPTAVPTTLSDSFITFTPSVSGVALLDRPPPLNQSTRVEIYKLVKANPGIHFRGICNSLNLPVGVVQYHLSFLIRAGLVTSFLDGRYRRYFVSKKLSVKEMKIVSLIRRKKTGQILQILLEKTKESHSNLSSKLSMSSQALTWQMRCLKRERIVHEIREGKKTIYFLDEASIPILRRYIIVK